jgi:hypothetical protein
METKNHKIMGNIEQTKCIFTDYEATPLMNGTDAIEYIIEINGKRHFIKLPHTAQNWNQENEFFKKNKHLFFGLIFNDNWFKDEKTYITIDELKDLLKSKTFPKTPHEKLENLFTYLVKFQNEDGDLINVDLDFYKNILWKILYFKSVNELNYYVDTLISKYLIQGEFKQNMEYSSKLLEKYWVTFEGLNHFIEINEAGLNSTNCFIAMAFKPETKEIRQAIKEAVEESGFSPILADELNIDSDTTINDAIFANLRKCKFSVSDFSFHSPGVYFESGFALGQGKKVIYTCQKEEFEKAHFDLKPLQHIIYETSESLKKELKNKIEAWIK